MKHKFKFRLFVMCVIAVFVAMAFGALASTAITNEFWISTAPNGNLYANGATGTIDNPLDGSSQTNFDYNMQCLPPNSTIHIMGGVYKTLGSNFWGPKTGQRIIGSGENITAIQLINVTAPSTVIGSYYASSVTNVEIADLTCDCNYQIDGSGIIIIGTGNLIRRVKVVNISTAGTTYHEGWGIVLENKYLPQAGGNTIEECEVSNFAGGLAYDNLSAIGMIDNVGFPNPGVIRNCRVLGSCVSATNEIFAYFCGNDSLLEGNYAENVQAGFRSETAMTNLVFVNNILVNCGVGVDLEENPVGQVYQNLTFANNQIQLTNSIYAWAEAFDFYGNGYYNKVIIAGNTVTYDGLPVAGEGWFVNVVNVSGMNVVYNAVDSFLTNQFLTCTNINVENNYHLYGDYFNALNVPVIGSVPVTNFGLNLAGGAGASPALTGPGLPSNPSTVTTNSSSLPVAFDTNLTVVVNPLVSTNRSFFILPPDAYIADLSGTPITAGFPRIVSWMCPSNSNGSIIKSLPLPNDFWGGKTTFVTSWKVRTTNSGVYSFSVENDYIRMNEAVIGTYKTITYMAPSGTNTTTIVATNTINTPDVNYLDALIYTGNQVQPGNFFVLSGKVTAQ